MRHVVLASTSPVRRRILQDAGIEVSCVPPGVDETTYIDADPAVRALSLAIAKARAVPAGLDRIVIGADQVVFDPRSGEVFGKPLGDADHVARLRDLRGREHVLITGFCARAADGTERTGVESTVVWMRGDVQDDEIQRYVASGEARGCAGGYAAELRGAFLIERLDGDWTNVLGLPLLRVLDALRAFGWRHGG
jgi:septum formation protein